ncbi:Mg2+ transporter protein, CorA-like/Zinc transport protein ZntB [Rhodotorula toruloides]|uniref:Mg2+ transporter protein, CorA-like/Zinc transport protein ZntB n=1 Tax=Rhodotorula toruloides TaxID=5286 RepID=A0A511KEB6_RHOTO|nr:Mg2+ transporter protein, CorA-like/Zinc transport protein ZntB [Rhodotorula toruloides]
MDGMELGELGAATLGSRLSEDRRATREGDDARETAERQDVRDSLEGDMGVGRLDAASPGIAARPPRPDFIDLALPDLYLPGPALDVPTLPSMWTGLADLRKRPSNLASAAASSPSLRTHFNLSGSPPLPSSVPLRPILQNPSSPSGRPVDHDAPRPHRTERPSSPTFASREDDEPHPEGLPHRERRTPHPLYTPAPRKRRIRRRKAESVASGRTGKSSRSARSKVKHALRKVRRRRTRRTSIATGTTSTSSSSSSSSSTTTTTTSGSSRSSTAGSTRSSSTWAGWRFWRNSSSGSSSSDDDDSETDSEWDPPTPHLTLLTPILSRPTLAYPAHLFSGASGPTIPASASAAGTLGPTSGLATPGPSDSPSATVFELATSSTLAPAIDRLQAFWSERQQEDGLAGDIGAGVAGAATQPVPTDEASYFPDNPTAYAEEAAENGYTNTAAAPAVTPGVLGGPSNKRLRGQQRTARAEQRRLGKNRAMENGPAWWLDIMCPSVADMRELRKLVPLHPLTIEDILHQETREKMESFAGLGYYFIVFRALDESYFRYTSLSLSPTPSPSTHAVTEPDGTSETAEKADAASLAAMGFSSGRRGRVDIVEGVGGKEGVEGVGVGAINLYLIVFGDGIISFHFEPIDQHIERVQGKLQQFGISRNFSSHWIAYSLMDSMVDAFFPLMDFIEGESNEVDAYLADPRDQHSVNPKLAPSGVGVVGGRKIFDESVVSIVVGEPSEGDKDKLDSDASIVSIKRATVVRRAPITVLRFLPIVPLPGGLQRILPRTWVRQTTRKFASTMLVDHDGIELHTLSKQRPVDVGVVPPHMSVSDDRLVSSGKFDRAVMLKRITDMRRLVVGLSRLLGPKTDVVRGLRKRTMEENLGLFKGDVKHDIAVYLGDLQDHIVAMQQSLVFYDAILAHDHPAYLSVLRLSLEHAKRGTDMALVKLYIVALTFLPINIVTSLFSINPQRPQNGDANHLNPNGTPAPFTWFGGVIVLVFAVAVLIWGFVWFIFRSSRRARKERGSPMR